MSLSFRHAPHVRFVRVQVISVFCKQHKKTLLNSWKIEQSVKSQVRGLTLTGRETSFLRVCLCWGITAVLHSWQLSSLKPQRARFVNGDISCTTFTLSYKTEPIAIESKNFHQTKNTNKPFIIRKTFALSDFTGIPSPSSLSISLFFFLALITDVGRSFSWYSNELAMKFGNYYF